VAANGQDDAGRRVSRPFRCDLRASAANWGLARVGVPNLVEVDVGWGGAGNWRPPNSERGVRLVMIYGS